MKLITVVSSLLISLAMASPAFDERDVTPEGLWKRDCPGNPVEKPVCPYGFYAVGFSQPDPAIPLALYLNLM